MKGKMVVKISWAKKLVKPKPETVKFCTSGYKLIN